MFARLYLNNPPKHNLDLCIVPQFSQQHKQKKQINQPPINLCGKLKKKRKKKVHYFKYVNKMICLKGDWFCQRV